MISKETAMDIAKRLAAKYRSRTTALVTEDDLYNEAFIAALEQEIENLAYVKANFACFNLICNKIRSTSEHYYFEKSALAVEYRKRLFRKLKTQEPQTDRLDLLLDLNDAVSILSPDECMILSLRVIGRLSQTETANRFHTTRKVIAEIEENILRKLRLKLRDWRL